MQHALGVSGMLTAQRVMPRMHITHVATDECQKASQLWHPTRPSNELDALDQVTESVLLVPACGLH
jgi:hypothetical protein